MKQPSHTNHRWVVIDNDLMISLTTPGLGPDQLWADFSKELSTKPITRYLAASLGSLEVTSIQRKMVSEITARHGIPVAVLTDEQMVRGLVTAVSWLGVKIKSFSWDDTKEALDHLDVVEPQRGRATEALSKLKLSYRS
jgi:hypothetical protein